jgi:hypothetical protein
VPKCSKVSKIFDRLGLFAFSSGPLARRAFAFAKVVKAADHPNLGLAEAQARGCGVAFRRPTFPMLIRRARSSGVTAKSIKRRLQFLK